MNGTVPILFDMYGGDDVAFTFECKDEQGDPVDISGWLISTTMKLSPKQTDAQAPVAVDTLVPAGADAVAGIVHILLPKEQTVNLLQAKYIFSMQRSFNDFVSTIIHGKVNVTQGITLRNAV